MNLKLPGNLHSIDASNPLTSRWASEPPAALSTLRVKWAKHQDEVRQAQRLRYQVFVGEMGATLPTPLAGHDVDEFDDHCEHLLVMHPSHDQVIGTYRLLPPPAARRMGRLYSEQEFMIQGLDAYRQRLVELGRSCVHPDHRQDGVIMALWGALARFMQSNQLDVMLGCASIPMWHNGVVSLHRAQSIWQSIQPAQRTQAPELATPLLPLPLPLPWSQADGALTPSAARETEMPALIKGYLRLGAKVMGPPAWDPDFHTADLPMFMKWSDLHPRYARHFNQV